MKNKNIIIVLCFLFLSSYAQQVSQLEIDENSKSGNLKDIISSFYQLTTKDLSGDQKSIGFNSTLYAIRSKADPNLLLDVNYIRERFARNFQLNFKIDLDKTYKYSGFTGGITYALINNRDQTMANYAGTPLDTDFSNLLALLNVEQANHVASIMGNPAIVNKSAELQLLQNAIDEILDNENLSLNPPVGSYAYQILSSINPKILASSYLNSAGAVINNRDDLMTNIANYYNELQSKGLLAISVDGSSDEIGKFNKASFGLTYLKGNREATNEIDVRGKLIYADTLLSDHMPRLELNAKAGLNFKFGGNSKRQNTFEIKAIFEYNKILKNVLPDEKEENFLANADFRFRLTDNLWIPLIIKYDIEKSNFLGFLNITYNFEAL